MRAAAAFGLLAALLSSACGKDKPIDRDVPQRREAEDERSARPPVGTRWPVVEIDEAGTVLLDGEDMGSTVAVVSSGQVRVFDRLHARLSERRKEWELAAPVGARFPEVIGLRVAGGVPGLVLKSAILSLASAQYGAITLQVTGAPALYDLRLEPPSTDDWVLHVTPRRAADGTRWTIAWFVMAIMEDDATEASDATLTAELCRRYEATEHDKSPRVVVHVLDDARARDVARSFAAVTACGATALALHVSAT